MSDLYIKKNKKTKQLYVFEAGLVFSFAENAKK